MQEPKSNPYEEFARVFSMFASAEEVTNRAAIEEEDALPQDEEAEEAAEVKVSSLDCLQAFDGSEVMYCSIRCIYDNSHLSRNVTACCC